MINILNMNYVSINIKNAIQIQHSHPLKIVKPTYFTIEEQDRINSRRLSRLLLLCDS